MQGPGKSVVLLVQGFNAEMAFFDFVDFEHAWILFGFSLAKGPIRSGWLDLIRIKFLKQIEKSERLTMKGSFSMFCECCLFANDLSRRN